MHVYMSRANRERQLRRSLANFFAAAAVGCVVTMIATLTLPIFATIAVKLGMLEAQVVTQWLVDYMNSNYTKALALSSLICTAFFWLVSILIRPWTPPR